jgi:hypothetical protein
VSARVLLVTGASRGIGPRLRPARGPTGLGVIGAAASIVAASGASAATAVIDGITVNDYGRVDPAGPDFAQPGVGTGTA